MIKIFVTLALILISSKTYAWDSDLIVVVKGDKEQVLKLAHKAMEVEFNTGVFTNYDGRIGYKVFYNSFISGSTEFAVGLTPASTEGVITTAFAMDIAYKSQKGGQGYIAQIAKNLKAEIIKQAPLIGNVSVVENTADYKSLGEQTDKCMMKLQNDPELFGLADKVALSNADNASLAMLTNDTKPTEAEKILISLWSSKKNTCAQGTLELLNYYPNNQQGLIYQQSRNETNQIVASLYKGNITYSEFAKQRQDLNSNNRKQQNQVQANQNAQQQTNTEIERQHQIEQQRNNIEQQKANSMLIQSIQTPTIQTPMPIRVNPTTNCTSRVFGNSVQTTCN